MLPALPVVHLDHTEQFEEAVGFGFVSELHATPHCAFTYVTGKVTLPLLLDLV